MRPVPPWANQPPPPWGITWMGPISSALRTTGGFLRFRVRRSMYRFFVAKSGSLEVFHVRMDWRETSASWRITRSHSSLMDSTIPRLPPSAEAGKAPLLVRQVQVARPRRGEVDEALPLLLRELRGTPGAPLRLQHGEAVGVEGVDQVPDVLLGHPRDQGDLRRREALGAGEDHLGPLHLDRLAPVAHDPPQLVPFLVRDVPDPQHHGGGVWRSLA